VRTRHLFVASSLVGVLLYRMSCVAHTSQVVSEHYTPLARFVKHGVPVVVATDNDGIMRMVGGGIFSGQSVKSELWHAVIHGCLAPAVAPDADEAYYPPLRVLDACYDGDAALAGDERSRKRRRCEEVPASPHSVAAPGTVCRVGGQELYSSASGSPFWWTTWTNVDKILKNMDLARFGRKVSPTAVPLAAPLS
jgi:hypothetical protein